MNSIAVPARRAGRAWSWLALLPWAMACLPVIASAAEPTEGTNSELRKVQAACLYNFYFYVRGLPSQGADTSFAIGILGDDPFGEHLEAVRGLEVEGQAVQLHRASEPAALENCDVIFISESERHRLEEILNHFKGKPHVLVSDMSDFANAGGTVGFVLADGRVGFEINHRTARESSLELSSHLLRLAQEVWE